jgi:hypothetical protein
MTNEQLEQGNKIKKEIESLESFIRKAETTWTGKIIKKTSTYIFRSNPYGAMDSAELELDTEMKIKVLDLLRERVIVLKKRLEEV